MKTKEQTPAVLAIVKEDDKFLFTQRSIKSRFEPGKWGFVGEAIKFGESSLEGLERGLKEETGLELKSHELFNIYSLVFDSPDKLRHAVIIVYICECGGDVKLNHESDDYKWLALEQSEKLNLIKGNERIIEDLKERFNNP